MKKIVSFYDPYLPDPFLVFSLENGVLTTIHAAHEMGNYVERLQNRGLCEWVGVPGRRMPRKTMPSDENFLLYLAEYQQRCYNNKVVVETSEE